MVNADTSQGDVNTFTKGVWQKQVHRTLSLPYVVQQYCAYAERIKLE